MSRALPGFFVSLEGVDGAGKSTQAASLAAALRAERRDVVAIREPGGTGLGELVREVLLHRHLGAEPAPLAEAALFLAARLQLVAEVVGPALARGAMVVADRFVDSSLVYQGLAQGVDPDVILEIHRLSGVDRLPDLTLLLDLPEGRAAGRLGRGRPLDRIEQATSGGDGRIREGFRELARRFPDRIVVVDADRPPSMVAARCLELVRLRQPAAVRA
ncbi:MAG TPA: dTMP kinase [Candidatus Micrarchaeia archaeon]|nr:dTMP kinase [Candidatus Micrarchaeia archaeon]